MRIPEAVFLELQDAGAPPETSVWVRCHPNWLIVEHVTPPPEEGLEKLGAGERAAIALSLQHAPDVLFLMDETKGRRAAEQRGIRVMGTLGVLHLAAARALIDLPETIDRLLRTTFYLTPSLLKKLLDEDSQRKHLKNSQ